MTNRAVAPEHIVIIFARVPRLGQVKTRLARSVGEHEALRVHRSLLGRTMQAAARVEGARVQLCVAGEDSEGECAALAASCGAQLASQQGVDLGRRMRHSIADALARGLRPILVGSDCPALTPQDIADGFDALEQFEAVFAPTEDGGYALVGARREIDCAFDRIVWGGPQVMRTTRERLGEARIRWGELRTLWDLDGLDDYRRWRALDAPRRSPSPPARR